MLISNSNSRELIRKPIYKKAYVWIFVLCIILIIVGLIITTSIVYIPSVGYLEEGYEDYVELLLRLPALSVLFQNIGIALFSVALFLGAITDETISREVKKGMIIASGLGIIALILSRMAILFGYA